MQSVSMKALTETSQRPRVAAHVVRRIAVTVGADPRTVRRVLAGERLRSGALDERIRIATAAEGIAIEPPSPVHPHAR
jgi:predicted transcriptional regulator